MQGGCASIPIIEAGNVNYYKNVVSESKKKKTTPANAYRRDAHNIVIRSAPITVRI